MRVHQLTRAFGRVQALDGVEWTAQPGQVTCLLGPNGAGKTTTVEIAEGLQHADSGTVEVLGTDPWRASAEHRARVGVMLQDGGLPQSVKPLALLHHLARFYAAPADVEALVTELDINDFAGTTVRRLSGGQRQRVALAAALVGRPDVLFLDEPTAGLDPHVRRTVWELIARTAREGATVVVTTHSFEEAERLADHLVIMARGRTVAEGTPAQVAGGETLESAYFALTDRRETP
ncbi:ABC transporter ATP-binding protein [Ornithinimicrobium faecis]|uniref:ABC transporter ATP-binding protein n=1 Tax=Ornithinimicrobium faecis TaxID=2934158 RepID=A0ABY4YZH0_9MICO|nr:ABC transporter ATP-binding protein [Ornithinimicrobium sp. HY1793]USQ82179.1 ABC transporter ATP-binding protein [Ornithinimicrobium sp. HY1793]